MTIRQLLFLDDSIAAPPAPTGLPEGYAFFANNGHLWVLRAGVFVDITPASGSAASAGALVDQQNTAFALDLTLSGRIQEVTNGGAINISLPAGLNSALADNSYPVWQIDVLLTSGVVTLTPGVGVLINNTNAVRTITGGGSSVVLRRTLAPGERYILVGAYS